MKELILHQDKDGSWAAECDKIPGYIAKGKTQAEAIENMKKALSLYFPCGPCKGSSEE